MLSNLFELFRTVSKAKSAPDSNPIRESVMKFLKTKKSRYLYTQIKELYFLFKMAQSF